MQLPIFPDRRQTLKPIFALILLSACLFPPALFAHEGNHKHVLVLHSYHPGLPWTDGIMAGMHEVFDKKPGIQLHIEYLDTQRYPGREYLTVVLDALFHHKLGGKQLDLVVLSDNDALNFVRKHSDDLFAGTPVVFCGINNFRPEWIADLPGFTGIAEYPSYAETIEIALALHPDTAEIVVIGGIANSSSRENRQMLANRVNERPFPVRFTFWDDVPVEDLAGRLDELPARTLVLVNGSVAARSGETLSFIEGIHAIRSHCPRPIYSFWDFFLGEGIVGGKLVSSREQGRMAAEIGMRILGGEDAGAIPVTTGTNRFMFDQRELDRFGISSRRLPEGSIVVNQPPPVYALSRGELWAGLLLMTGLVIVLVGNLIRRIRAEHAVREQKERINLLLDSTAEAIYGVDANGLCTFCNPAALRLLGYAHQDELLGKNIHELIHHTGPQGEVNPLAECRMVLAARQAKEIHLEDEIYWRADGSSFPAEVWSYPIRRGSETVGAVVTFLDISERKEAEAKREEALRELNAFVYTVSHDLRAPLTGIIGYSEFLQEQSVIHQDENVRLALTEIQSQGERMAAMLEDLLDLARVGQLPSPVEPVDTSQVLDAVLRGMAEQIAGVGVPVQKGSLPAVRIPETFLTQIFTNLIGNSVRYAGKEGGPIEVGGIRWGRRVRFFVRDHGPGVPANERDRIFDVFYRGATGRKSPGTGIGLATVRKIAQHHGGRAWVDETPGGGATFWVEVAEDRS